MGPLVSAWLLMWLWAVPAHADWINLTGAQSAPNIAEFFVNDDHVRLGLELYVKDLDKFVDLLPDDFLFLRKFVRNPNGKRQDIMRNMITVGAVRRSRELTS